MNSMICSEHFKVGYFSRRFSGIEGESSVSNRWLKRDEIGICVFPTITAPNEEKQSASVSDRDKRMVRILTQYRYFNYKLNMLYFNTNMFLLFENMPNEFNINVDRKKLKLKIKTDGLLYNLL